MPPRSIKTRPIPREVLERLILMARIARRTEAWIDDEIASRVWADGFGRMWRYVGQWMKVPR